MHAVSRALLAVSLLAASVSAQQPEADVTPTMRGSFRIVNATGLTGSVFFSVNGRSINPRGFAAGKRTGQMGLGAGQYLIKANHSTLGEVTHALNLVENSQISLLLYLEEKKTEKDGEPPKQELAFHVLPAGPGTEGAATSLTIIQLTRAETLNVSVDSISLVAERLKPSHINSVAGLVQEPTIKVNGTKLCTYNLEEKEEYVLALYADAKGHVHPIKFSNTP